MKCEKQDDQSDGISIQNIGGVFIVIFIGIGLACVTLSLEYYWYKWRKRPTIGDVTQVSVKKNLVSIIFFVTYVLFLGKRMLRTKKFTCTRTAAILICMLFNKNVPPLVSL